ncbi:hypothetical protein SMICM17S_10733 [Streptomyces microflavus]
MLTSHCRTPPRRAVSNISGKSSTPEPTSAKSPFGAMSFTWSAGTARGADEQLARGGGATLGRPVQIQLEPDQLRIGLGEQDVVQADPVHHLVVASMVVVQQLQPGLPGDEPRPGELPCHFPVSGGEWSEPGRLGTTIHRPPRVWTSSSARGSPEPVTMS